MSIADKYREGFDFFELGFCSEIIIKKKLERRRSREEKEEKREKIRKGKAMRVSR